MLNTMLNKLRIGPKLLLAPMLVLLLLILLKNNFSRQQRYKEFNLCISLYYIGNNRNDHPGLPG